MPLATAGRGDAGYLAVASDGRRIFVAWEDMLWALDSGSLQAEAQLRLPASVDGMALSIDGIELYLLPSTMGDLSAEERGMFTVDTAKMKLARHADDWPELSLPFFLAAPAAERP